MENIIQEHVDKQDALEDEFFDEVDKIFGKIDVAEAINDPAGLAEAIRSEVMVILESLSDQAVKNGIEVGKMFSVLEKKGKEIIIEDAVSGDQNEL